MSGTVDKPVDYLEMSDEDFLNSAPPEVTETPSTENQQEEEQVHESEPANTISAEENNSANTETTAENENQNTKSSETVVDDENNQHNKDGEHNPVPLVDPAKLKNAPEDKPESNENTSEAPPVNYEEAYKKMLTFKANGKTVQLNNPEEAIQLMQMGANYTRKMQEFAPHRKTMLMLQQNGLLEGDTLSFLIDLKNGNKEAIKKLVKDSGIDPMDIDTSVEPQYHTSNHAPTDNEVRFSSILDDIKSTPEGNKTIQLLNGLDQASLDALWKEPEVMSVLNEQRANGIYDTISAEIDRRKMLGVIPTTMPFLQAYQQVGNELNSSGVLGSIQQPTTPVKEPVAPVITRPLAPKTNKVQNSDKANAASPSRSTPSSAQKSVNYLAMSDDEFLKKMENRL